MEKTQQICNESPVLLFLGGATSTGAAAFFKRMGTRHDAANPRNRSWLLEIVDAVISVVSFA